MQSPGEGDTQGAPIHSRGLSAVRVVLALFVGGIIIWRVSPRDAWDALREAEPTFVLVAVSVVVLSRAAFTLRWHLLLRALGVKHPYVHTLGLTLIALLYQKVGPATLVGDATKAYLAADAHDLELSEAAASVAADRLVGLISILVLGIIAGVLLEVPLLQTTLLAFLALCLVSVAAVALALRWASRAPDSDAQHRAITRRILSWVGARTRGLARGFAACGRDKQGMALAFVASCGGICLMAIAFQAWCRALGWGLTFTEAVSIVVLSSIIAMMPITLNGLIVAEGAQILLLGWTGMAEPDALAMAVMHRVTTTAIALTGVPVHFLRDITTCREKDKPGSSTGSEP